MMNDLRSQSGVRRREAFTFVLDGLEVVAYPGESIAAAALARGHRGFARGVRTGRLRGLFCGMGICFECTAEVDGVRGVVLCQTPARPGLVVNTPSGGAGRD